MHAPTSNFLKVKTRTSVGRLKGLFPDLDRTAFLSAMGSVRRSLSRAANAQISEGLFAERTDAGSLARLAIPADDSSLQWAPVATGITGDLDQAFDRLYERLVSKYDHRATHRRTDDDVWRPVREKISERGLAVPFEEKHVQGANDEISFKHAWKNGAWHAYEALSLDLADADGIKDKARRWRGHLDAVFDGATDDYQLNFILGAPSNPRLLPAFENAVAILRKAPTNPVVYTENQIDELVSELEDEVRAHEASHQ
jgi:hypothetical protein